MLGYGPEGVWHELRDGKGGWFLTSGVRKQRFAGLGPDQAAARLVNALMNGILPRRCTMRPCALVIVFLLLASCPAWADTRLYVSQFGSGRLVAIDAEAGRVVFTVPVEDRAGIVGCAASHDGRRLYVVDGNSRLRVVDAGSGRVLAAVPFENRALLLGGANPVHLAPHGRTLLVQTYDYKAAAPGVCLFDTAAESFVPLGMRNRPGGLSNLVNGQDVLFAVGAHELWAMAPGPDREWWPRQRIQVTLPVVWGVSAIRDVLYVVGPPGERWELVRWKAGAERVDRVDLLKKLHLEHDPRGNSVRLVAPPDGSWLAVGHGRWLGFLDPDTLDVKRVLTLPDLGEAAIPSADGRMLYLLGSDRCLRSLDVASGRLRTIMKLPFEQGGPPVDVIGPSSDRDISERPHEAVREILRPGHES